MAILRSSKSVPRLARNRDLANSSAADFALTDPFPKKLLPRVSLNKGNFLPGLSSPQSNDTRQDKLIKSLLKLFKRVEVALGKFDGKLNDITKTNILRTVVLPFLRLLLPLHVVFDMDSKIYLSFASILTSVLGLWWRLLLSCLNITGSLQVSATDRSAYIECVSRILARKEWLHAETQTKEVYTQCLTDTLDFSIMRLLSFKVVPIAISAFVGKVFAYAYFHLPEVCNALLFLLNVKQKTLDKLALAFLPLSQDCRDEARTRFGLHVSHLIDYRGLEKLEKLKRRAINCMVPPKHPVKGIRDPSGPWVRRWCSSDSDIFNSFFRHYINIAHSFVDGSLPVSVSAFPGFRVIASFIYQVLSVSVNRILFTKAPVNAGNNGTSGANGNSAKQAGAPNNTQKPKEGTAGSALPPSSLAYKQADSNYTSITKLFRSIRNISYSLISFANQITRVIDLLLANVAQLIGLYDVHKTSLLLNLVYEYLIHVYDASDMDWQFWLECSHLMLTSTYHVQIITRNFAFLFNVWDRIPSLLPESDVRKPLGWLTDPSESLKANFSAWLTSSPVWLVCFTHWNPLVRSHYLRLLVWRVIGANNFETTCSMQTTRRIKQKIDFVFASLCKVLACEDLPRSMAALDFSADSPIVNRKFGIVPVNNKYSYMDEMASVTSVSAVSKTSDLRKTHPYEIFDEAIYTCTSLPSSPAQTQTHAQGSNADYADYADSAADLKTKGNHSTIDSLSRFFKMLSSENLSDKDVLVMTPPKRIRCGRSKNEFVGRGTPLSKSMTSISMAPYMKPLSLLAPSTASTQPSMDLNNDNSMESSVTSDSDSSLSDRVPSSSASTYSLNSSSNLQPPELVKVPPEIVRPIFKFDIVLDHEVASAKFTRMQDLKSSWTKSVFYGSLREPNMSYLTFPKPPKIPSVSIYLNSDAYNKFFVTRETCLINEEVSSAQDIEDFMAFRRDLGPRLAMLTELATLGKALNEWNLAVEEFENYLFEKVEADQANYLPMTLDGNAKARTLNEINEAEYFARIIPLLPIDNLTELKLLNAA